MIWRVQMLGGLTVSRGSQVITRFESSRVAALLAHLALFSRHPASREELIELLWPEEEFEVGRHRLRQAIYSLRRQLEPPGIPPNSILSANRLTVSLNPTTFSCDAADFERLVRKGRSAEALEAYLGDLLPGFYDEWILTERCRLQSLFEDLSDIAIGAEKTTNVKLDAQRPFVSLPSILTDYFGRADEKRTLAGMLASHRLITITGMGGIGKTRLAVEVARETSTEFESTAFVPLARSIHEESKRSTLCRI